MKELSTEQKAKAYDESLERAKKLQETCDSTAVVGWCEYIFPELKESEEEKIRKAIICGMNALKNNQKKETFADIPLDDCIAWLKKKDKWRTEDKFEPKFHKGDWIIFNENRNSTYQVERIGNYRYYLRHYLGGTLSVPFDSELIRLWTIQDAKDGDVLACNEEILLFKSYSIQGRISLYCWYNGQTNNFHSKEVVDTLLTTRYKICPATKEQRDLLFAKMKEAGYEWDGEKKELKKIESKMLDADKVIEWIDDQACQGWIEDIEVDKFVDKFKKDFGLLYERDKNSKTT